ncbi:MAG: hypothetical protein EXS67_04060 [Candidatus Margulisbacteria bacterium]|nr:hypothetical protein [Candidatus Margulisiibacteriota bacterium]
MSFIKRIAVSVGCLALGIAFFSELSAYEVGAWETNSRFATFGPTENRIISPSNTYFELKSSQDIQLNFGLGFKPISGYNFFVETKKAISKRWEVLINYTSNPGNKSKNIYGKNIYGLGLQGQLFWDPENLVGLKGRFMLNDLIFENSRSVMEVRANVLISKQVGRTLFFTGIRTPIAQMKSSSDFDVEGEGLSPLAYVGVEQKINEWFCLSGLYYKNIFSAGITVLIPGFSLPVRLARDGGDWMILSGHPYWDY